MDDGVLHLPVGTGTKCACGLHSMPHVQQWMYKVINRSAFSCCTPTGYGLRSRVRHGAAAVLHTGASP